jgi:3-oxoadipate enol-lactonase
LVETRQIDGRTVTFRHDEGRGPSLVCIHGPAGNHHAFDRLLDALPGHDRYAINLPGRAGTDGPPLSTVTEMELFLSAFLASVVAGDYVIVGHSVGGGVAIEHALVSGSERLKGVVLLATGGRLRVHRLILELFDQVAEAGAAPPLPPGLFQRDADSELLAETSKYLALTPFESAGTDWRASDGFDRMDDLKQIQAPALIVTGTNDTFTPPKYAEYLAANIADSEISVIQGAGHMLFIERVPEVSDAIERFVSQF